MNKAKRLHQGLFFWALLLFSLSCGDSSTLFGALSLCVGVGQEMTVSGTVMGVTFDNMKNGEGPSTYYELLDKRVYLMKDLDIVTFRCPLGDLDDGRDSWGLGIEISPDTFGEEFPSPRDGDRLTASGTLQEMERYGRLFPIMGNVGRLEIDQKSDDSSPIKLAGQPCSSDMECDDQLFCNRESSLCDAPPMFVNRKSSWHDANGTCETDADCPVGQTCHLSYTLEDGSKHICVLAEGSELQTRCPRVGTSADLVGGRYVTGKEVCIREEVMLLYPGEGISKIHVQLRVKSPEIYPEATNLYALFGATTEISPPYRDPALGGYAISPPEVGDEIIVLGTYRFDDPHGWFEVHPIKEWWVAD